MSTGPDGDESRVDLGKDSGAGGAPAEPPFDPYRFGKPDYPVPPEYAPPGYVPDDPPPSAAPPGVYPPPPYAQGQYPPPRAYGRPPYGAGPGRAPGRAPGQAGGNGKAVTALVCGVLSIVLCWLTLLVLIVVVPAIVFGILGLNEAKTRDGAGRGMAIAGIVCAVVAAVLATVLTIFAVRAADRCGGIDNTNDPSFQQCVQDNFLP